MLLTKAQSVVKEASEMNVSTVSFESSDFVEGQTVRVKSRGRGNLVSQPIPGIWVVAFSEMQGCGYVFESDLSAV